MNEKGDPAGEYGKGVPKGDVKVKGLAGVKK